MHDTRSLIVRFALGATLGWVFLAGLAYTEHPAIALVQRSDVGALALLMLGIAFGGTFGTSYLATSLTLERPDE
jgi:hypothetical protein